MPRPPKPELTGADKPDAPDVAPTPNAGPATIDVPKLDKDTGGELPPPPSPEPEGEDAPRPKRGRPRGSRSRKRQEPEPAPGPSPEEVGELAGALGVGLDLGFQIIAGRRGPHWRLSDAERDTLGQAWAPVLAPYMASVAAYTPAAFALLATWGIVGPKLERDREIAAGTASGRLGGAGSPSPASDGIDAAEGDARTRAGSGEPQGPKNGTGGPS